MRCVVIAILLLLGASGVARAQQAVAPSGLPDPYAPPPPNSAPPATPPPYGVPPPRYEPYAGPTPMQIFAYENNKKTPAIALVAELFIPGLGSLYGEHAMGALVTWGGMIGGLVLVVAGLNDHAQPERPASEDVLVVAGVAAVIGFRVYGIVDAYSSTETYNRQLALSLHLPAMMVSLAPLQTPRGVAYAPSLTLHF